MIIIQRLVYCKRMQMIAVMQMKILLMLITIMLQKKILRESDIIKRILLTIILMNL